MSATRNWHTVLMPVLIYYSMAFTGATYSSNFIFRTSMTGMDVPDTYNLAMLTTRDCSGINCYSSLEILKKKIWIPSHRA